MLVEEYFREIEGWITDCPYVVESCIEKDKRSFHVGIIEGRIEFTPKFCNWPQMHADKRR